MALLGHVLVFVSSLFVRDECVVVSKVVQEWVLEVLVDLIRSNPHDLRPCEDRGLGI